MSISVPALALLQELSLAIRRDLGASMTDAPFRMIKTEMPEGVSPDTVRLLHWLAREASQGRIHAIAFCVLRTTSEGERVTTEGRHASDSPDARDLIAGLEVVKHQLAAYVIETSGAPTDAPILHDGERP